MFNRLLHKKADQKLGIAVSAMLAETNHLEKHSSKADDAGTEVRTSKFFAARTINQFQSGTEFEVRTMIAALIGMRSEVTSENFHYLFPWEFVSHLSNAFNKNKKAIDTERNDFHCVANEEDDEERCRQEDVLKRVVLVQDGDQRKSDGTSQAAVGQNELLLEVKECPMSRIELYLTPMGLFQSGIKKSKVIK